MLRSEYRNKWIMRCRTIAWVFNMIVFVLGCFLTVMFLILGITELVNGEEKTSYFGVMFWSGYAVITPLLVFNALTTSPSEIKSDTVFCVSESLVVIFLLLHSLFSEQASASYGVGIALLSVLAVGIFFSSYFTCPATKIRLFIAHFFSSTHLTREDWVTETEHYNERKSLLACICGGGLIVFAVFAFMAFLMMIIEGVPNLYEEEIAAFILFVLLLVLPCAELIVLCRIYVLVGKEKERGVYSMTGTGSGDFVPRAEEVTKEETEKETEEESGQSKSGSVLKRIGRKIKALVKDDQAENEEGEAAEKKRANELTGRVGSLLQKTGRKFFIKYYTQIRDWAETDVLDAVEEPYPAEMVLDRIRAGKRIFNEKLEIMALVAIIGSVHETDEETRQQARARIEQVLNTVAQTAEEAEQYIDRDIVSK